MNRLKALRQGKYTQAEVAKLLGVGRTTYTKYERGDIRLSADMLSRLAKLYGVRIETILGEEDDAPDEAELWEYREALRRDPERRMLFSLAKDATLDEVRQAVAVIDALKKANRADDDDPA